MIKSLLSAAAIALVSATASAQEFVHWQYLQHENALTDEKSANMIFIAPDGYTLVAQCAPLQHCVLSITPSDYISGETATLQIRIDHGEVYEETLIRSNRLYAQLYTQDQMRAFAEALADAQSRLVINITGESYGISTRIFGVNGSTSAARQFIDALDYIEEALAEADY